MKTTLDRVIEVIGFGAFGVWLISGSAWLIEHFETTPFEPTPGNVFIASSAVFVAVVLIEACVRSMRS